jgi:hypothetical protein
VIAIYSYCGSRFSSLGRDAVLASDAAVEDGVSFREPQSVPARTIRFEDFSLGMFPVPVQVAPLWI